MQDRTPKPSSHRLPLPKRGAALLALAVLALVLAVAPKQAQAADAPLSVNLTVGTDGGDAKLSGVVQVMLFMTVMSLLPALLLTMTSFTRIVIVLSFVRRAMSLQQMPPNQVVLGIALFLTAFVMYPAWQKVNTTAVQPYLQKDIGQKEAAIKALGVMRSFMVRNTREKDLALFVSISKTAKPKSVQDVPTYVVIPAFLTSEL